MFNIIFKNLKIQNGRVFKDISIPLQGVGITSILGVNGAGKSTLWAILEAIIYGTTPASRKAFPLVKGDKDASFQLDFSVGDDNYLVSYNKKKNKWGHKIVKNGVDETPHDSVGAAKKVKEIIGLDQDEFRGSVHLGQNAQHILISGKPCDRKEYVSTFFGLDERYDLVLEAAQQHLKEIKVKISNIAALSHSKMLLEDELNSLKYADPAHIEVEIANNDKTIMRLDQNIAYIEKERVDCIEYRKNIPYILQYENPEASLASVNANIQAVQTEINSLPIKRQHNAYVQSLNNNIEAAASELNRLKELYPNYEQEILNENEHNTKISELSTQKINYYQVKKFIDEAVNLPISKDQIIKISKIEKEINDLEREEYQSGMTYDNLAINVRRFESGKCPTCNHDVDKSLFNEDRKTMEKIYSRNEIIRTEIPVLVAKKKELEATQKIFNRAKSLKEAIGGVAVFGADKESVLESLTLLVGNISRIKACISFLEKNQMQSKYELPDEIMLNARLAELKGQESLFKGVIVLKNNLPKEPTRTLDSILNNLMEVQDLRELTDAKINELRTELGNINSNNAKYTKTKNQLSSIESQVSGLYDLKRQEFLYLKLVEAYGAKGLRVKKLNEIMNIVMTKLPSYVSLLFQEKGLTFSHNCDAGNIDILAKREEIKEDGTIYSFEHDVASLSGGENKRLSIAFVLTLADCVPFKKRTNLLILDELDSNLDSDGQYMFVNELLPALKDRYDSVFIISHAEEVNQAQVYDNIWKIKKKNHHSNVEMH